MLHFVAPLVVLTSSVREVKSKQERERERERESKNLFYKNCKRHTEREGESFMKA